MGDGKGQTANSKAPVVTLYTRKDCSLCEDAAALLRDLARDFQFDIEPVDIDADPALRDRYNDIIPVIAINGRELARAPFDAGAMRTALASALHADKSL